MLPGASNFSILKNASATICRDSIIQTEARRYKPGVRGEDSINTPPPAARLACHPLCHGIGLVNLSLAYSDIFPDDNFPGILLE